MIVASAIKYNGKTYTGKRHYEIIRTIRKEDECKIAILQEWQGFIDENGLFYNRADAAKHAIECKQISKLTAPPNLFSEDLW
jgi:hypothetical protein